MIKEPILNTSAVDPSWEQCLYLALEKMDQDYLAKLRQSTDWLPGPRNLFNAFRLPLNQVNYVLFGESPYPRAASANGYAFWDANVHELWSATGLTKTVNRATSLRNIIKMLLVAEGLLQPSQTSQADIAAINKDQLVQTNQALFQRFLDKGFLLLNATLVLQPHAVKKDAQAWQPFICSVLDFIYHQRPHAHLILLGNIANTIDPLILHPSIKRLYAEHPYNISFIQNEKILNFFEPLHLLRNK